VRPRVPEIGLAWTVASISDGLFLIEYVPGIYVIPLFANQYLLLFFIFHKFNLYNLSFPKSTE